MDASLIDVFLFAPLAPLFGMLLFWFIQLLFIESQKYLLWKLQPRHGPLVRFTNFIGILFQSLCHALGFTVTRSGVSHFSLSVHEGEVHPKKHKPGIFEWISNSFLFLGPFFIPAAMLMIALVFLIQENVGVPSPPSDFVSFYTFSNQLIVYGASLYSFSESFFVFLFSIDLFHPSHLGFLLLLIFLGLGIRPNYIGEKKRRKVDMIYDLTNIKNHIMSKPVYLLLLFLLLYCLFYLFFVFQLNWFVTLFSLFGWLSIISITALLIAHLLLILIWCTDQIPGLWWVVPYVVLFVSYVLTRGVCIVFNIEFGRSLALVLMLCLTVSVVVVLLYYKTNRFKSEGKMNAVRVEDGAGRSAGKRKR